MENQQQNNCSYNEHNHIKAIEYCQDCKIYLCNKCSIHHKGIKNHHYYNITTDPYDIFNNICKEINHQNKLE